MTSIKFHLRVSQSVENRTRRLFVRIIHNRKTLNISLPYSLYSGEWDGVRQEVVVPYGSRRITYLRKVAKGLSEEKQRLRSLVSKLEERGEFTIEQLKNAYQGQLSRNGLKVYTESLANVLIRQGKERTARAYKTSVTRFIEFTGLQDIAFEQLTSQTLILFEDFLKEQGRSLNTISFYMGNLRSIYNKAHREGIFISLETDLFKNVYTGKETTAKRALSKSDMIRLSSMELSDPDMNKSLRLFLFGFFSRGMAFVDMAYLRKENLHDGVIAYRRKKTGQYIEVKVTPQMRRILHSFQEETKDSPYLLPIITKSSLSARLQYESALRLQNKRLKKIAIECGLQKTLSTHVARHTWASMAKTADLPLAVISEGLGHTSIKTTSIYLSSFNRTVLDRANDKVSRLISVM